MEHNSDYEFEQQLIKFKANTNSEYLKKTEKLKYLEDYEISSLGDYIASLNLGKKNLDDFEKTNIILPKIGKIELYENSIISENRKTEGFEEVNSDLYKFSVVPLKNNSKQKQELVIDENGFDIGIINYTEKGKPKLEIADSLKEKINKMLTSVNARSQVDEKTIEEEFYLKDIDSFIRAAKEGKIIPKSLEEIGKRAASAKNIKNNNYKEEDARNSIIQTKEEIEKEKVDSVAVLKNSKIPENKKSEVKDVCRNSGFEEEKIAAVLIIKDPKPLADCTEKSHINRNGSEVTVIQFSNITGKERYVLIQDGISLGGEAHDRDFRDLIAPLKTTKGVYKRVEDNENYVDYVNSDGQHEIMKIRGIPDDISRTQKEYFRERFEILMDELEKARKNEPENTVKIDSLEQDIYDLCKYFNIVVNTSIKEAAEEVRDPKKTEEYRDEEDEYDPRERRAGDPRGPRY